MDITNATPVSSGQIAAQASAPAPRITIIKPEICRRVQFWPDAATVAAMGLNRLSAIQPMDAGVAFVFSDRDINIGFSDHLGVHHALTNVPLIHPGDEKPAESHCTWMPYQIEQALKDRI